MITILQKDAPVLRVRAEPVNSKDFGSPQLKKILADMQEALEKEEDGVAIAAPQIGVPLRIFVVSHRAFEFEDEDGARHPEETQIEGQKVQHADMIFINPVVNRRRARL